MRREKENMTTKTAAHLNALRSATRKVIVPTPDEAFYRANFGRIGKECFAAIERCKDAAVEQEIRDAARERRIADVGFSVDPYQAAGYIQTRDGAQRLAYQMAYPEMCAIAGRFNAATMARYEAYRLACEQGVAVPPEENGE